MSETEAETETDAVSVDAGPEDAVPETDTAESSTGAVEQDPVRSETAALQAISRPTVVEITGGLAVVVLLGALTRYFDTHVPRWAVDTPFQRVAKSIESRCTPSRSA
jgi:hypothetical protein